MIAYREPDGLNKIARILASLRHDVRMDDFRRRVQWFQLILFGKFFLVILAGETLFATIMFALIQVEVFGMVVSGEAFALLVPTVIGAAHVKLHHERDNFTRWWMKKLSGVGILFFALGISLMVGFSAWQAAEDAVSAISSTPSGMLGGRQIEATATSSGIAGWISVVPTSMLFAGLSLGMVVAIYFASFCLGRALQAFNILTLTPRAGDEVKTLIAELGTEITALRKEGDAQTSARRKLPFDMNVTFSRAAAHACWRVAQDKRAAARRKFDPLRHNDPLTAAFSDPDVESIPNDFQSEEAFLRHLNEQIDAVRLHNLLRVLTGIPEGEKP